MANKEREALWTERVARWRESGQSQRAFALAHGFEVRQMGYWVRRLAATMAPVAMMPITIKTASVAPELQLRSPSGWSITFPPSVDSEWLAALLRRL